MWKASIEVLRSARQVLIFGATCWGVDRYVVHMTTTEGPSMSPTLAAAGDIVLVDKLSPRLRAFAIRRGDIVVADSSYKAAYSVCKRVVALEGDTVTPSPAATRIHSTFYSGAGAGAGVTIPPGYVWLEGDNAQDSTDSRMYGPVPTALVRGRVIARVWPLDTFKLFDSTHPRPIANHARLTELLNDGDIQERAKRRVIARLAAAAAKEEELVFASAAAAAATASAAAAAAVIATANEDACLAEAHDVAVKEVEEVARLR
jgi:inner membrane protease subunit 1